PVPPRFSPPVAAPGTPDLSPRVLLPCRPGPVRSHGGPEQPRTAAPPPVLSCGPLRGDHCHGHSPCARPPRHRHRGRRLRNGALARSEEHTSELQSRENLVCRLLLEK